MTTGKTVDTQTRNMDMAFSGVMRGIGTIAGVGSLSALALGAGRAVIELGNLGQELNKQRAYFDVWSGGAANAAANMEAMRAAVGNSMTEMEMMTAANQLLSMGLAKTPEELRKLSEMAVMLGGSTRSAGEAINEFSLLLANQSILRLDTFGISGARVRERIEELQAAEEGLSREQAFMNAVMEIGTQKVSALAAAGVDATTATQDLTTAWGQAREEIAAGLDTAGVTAELARIVSGVGTAIGASLGGESSVLKVLQQDLAYLQQQRDAIEAGGGLFKGARLNELDQQIAAVTARIQEYTTVTAGMATGTQQVADGLREVGAAAAEIDTTAITEASTAIEDLTAKVDKRIEVALTGDLSGTELVLEGAQAAGFAEQFKNDILKAVAEIAGKAPTIYDELVNGAATAMAAKDNTSIVPALAEAISRDLSTSAALIQNQGGQAWVLLEAGILAKASASGVLRAAIQAALDALTEEYTSGR
jgi:hypothetical protein